jgi:hypothetical protein
VARKVPVSKTASSGKTRLTSLSTQFLRKKSKHSVNGLVNMYSTPTLRFNFLSSGASLRCHHRRRLIVDRNGVHGRNQIAAHCDRSLVKTALSVTFYLLSPYLPYCTSAIAEYHQSSHVVVCDVRRSMM